MKYPRKKSLTGVRRKVILTKELVSKGTCGGHHVIPGLTRNPAFFLDSRFRGNDENVILPMNFLVKRGSQRDEKGGGGSGTFQRAE